MLQQLTLGHFTLAADVVLSVHFGVALFLVLGQLSIVVGGFLNVRWIRNPWFRVVHLGLIVFIAGETWLGIGCPLTRLEQHLRILAGQPAYAETFTEHWLSPFLFCSAPAWIFISFHSVAALAIAATWFGLPPRWRTVTPIHDNRAVRETTSARQQHRCLNRLTLNVIAANISSSLAYTGLLVGSMSVGVALL